jgi:hypothetical protein
MFCIKGDNPEKEAIRSILSSVGSKETDSISDASFLFLLNRYGSLPRDLSNIITINRLSGSSKDRLTDKFELMKLFQTLKIGLPTLLFKTFQEHSITTFFNHGTTHKFLKASDGFAGSGNKVVDSVNEVKDFVDAYKPTKEFKGWILQDALETTATFHKYKFHLRVILVVVVHNRKTSIYISNYHTYVLSNQHYDVGRLKEATVYNTHKSRNTQNAFFPMERPDGWTIQHTEEAMRRIRQMLRSIFERHHIFQPDWKVKHGYEVLGVDVLFDTTHQPYILEINQKMALYPSQTMFLPEIFHLGLGGAPLKLFKSLYGVSHHTTTPFTESLTMFYNTQYKTVSEVRDSFNTLFHIPLVEESDKAYFEYQTSIKHHTRRAKSKARGSKTLKRGSRR